MILDIGYLDIGPGHEEVMILFGIWYLSFEISFSYGI